ncbi:MAG: hypothetical protein ACP5IE_03470 [Infirmifilum sp.]
MSSQLTKNKAYEQAQAEPYTPSDIDERPAKDITVEKSEMRTAVQAVYTYTRIEENPPFPSPTFMIPQTFIRERVDINIYVKSLDVPSPKINFKKLDISPISIEQKIDIDRETRQPPKPIVKTQDFSIAKIDIETATAVSPAPGGDIALYVGSLVEEALPILMPYLKNIAMPIIILHNDERLALSLAALALESLVTEYGIAREVATIGDRGQSTGPGVFLAEGDLKDTLITYEPKIVIANIKYENIIKRFRGIAHIIQATDIDTCKLACIAYAACGFCDESIRNVNSNDVVARFRLGEYELLKKVMDAVPYIKDRSSVGGEETSYHRLLKLFAIYHLIENLKVPLSQIYVEDEIGNRCGNVVPDVYAYVPDLGAVVIDVKTNFKQLPHRSLMSATEKYASCGEVWVVMRPIAFMLYTKEIIKTLRELKRQARKIEIYLPVRGRDGKPALVTYREFVERFKECIIKCSTSPESKKET